MTAPKPSQQPWTTRGAISNGRVFIADIYAGPHFVGSFVGGTEAQANELANTAIAARNSHDSLLSACEGALEVICFSRLGEQSHRPSCECKSCVVVKQLQSAIAEAGGGEAT